MKKTGFPIILSTVRKNAAGLCRVMREELDLLNGHYSIFPAGVGEGLYQDLETLIHHHIARRFDVIFYDPVYTKNVFLKRTYEVSGFETNGVRANALGVFLSQGHHIPTPFEFDIFVYFTKQFARLSEAERSVAVNQFCFKWFDFSKPHHQHLLTDAEVTPDDACDDEGTAETAGDTGDGSSFDFGGTAYQDDEAAMPLTPAKGKGGGVVNPFATGKSLFVATYTDSRRLLTEIVTIAAPLGLFPVQWTFSEGFKAVDDAYHGRYSFNDSDYYITTKNSPIDVLAHIKNNNRANTVYLLEDFHHYLSRSNFSGAEYAELISVIKSMPERLKQINSLLVILSPTADLPEEIAPIFEIIKDLCPVEKSFYLDKYGTDLTALVLTSGNFKADRARVHSSHDGGTQSRQSQVSNLKNKIKPVIGRESEITACLKVLLQMESNNPLLVGKAGVGKTAIVEGIAMRIVSGRVPDVFKQKKVVALNLNAMVSGTKYRGEFEKRLEAVLEEVKSSAGRVIVFIDELHTLLGMGGTEGSTGAENIIKPALARGDFPCIGATTEEEYTKFIAPDKALTRRFQLVEVTEPNVEDTIEILKGIKHVYEVHHQVTVPDTIIERCVALSNKVMSGQHFPGKAVKMLDSLCASSSLEGRKVITADFLEDEFNRMADM
ncbi:MAG: ATP-dependent Clp protease ATP-binding subunit [Deltaproteobacteria bacterium]|nr:ATP-dependent Clp protease ATP-binding subunit [Deltaproteobacteria bacterium]